MITYTARAVVWGLSRMLRIPEEQPVSHSDLEHAHWDSVARQWLVHRDELEAAQPRAA
jgi:hypothetical protein